MEANEFAKYKGLNADEAHERMLAEMAEQRRLHLAAVERGAEALRMERQRQGSFEPPVREPRAHPMAPKRIPGAARPMIAFADRPRRRPQGQKVVDARAAEAARQEQAAKDAAEAARVGHQQAVAAHEQQPAARAAEYDIVPDAAAGHRSTTRNVEEMMERARLATSPHGVVIRPDKARIARAGYTTYTFDCRRS